MNYEDLTYGQKPEIIAIADRLREMILAGDSHIAEDFYGGEKVRMASYSIGPKSNVIAVIGLADDHCKIFYHHVDKIDTAGLPFEGQGKHARHIKIFRIEDLQEAAYRDVTRQVVEVVKQHSNE